jgi:hypothetical protein
MGSQLREGETSGAIPKTPSDSEMKRVTDATSVSTREEIVMAS